MLNNKIMARLIYTVGFLCYCVFCITKSSALMSLTTETSTPYGNLFMNCRVSNFKIKLPPTKPTPLSFTEQPIDSCDLIIQGDSQVAVMPDHFQLYIELAQRTGKTACQYRYETRDPFYHFNRSGITRLDKRRVMLVECSEAFIYERYYNMPILRRSAQEQIVNRGMNERRLSPWQYFRKEFFVGTEQNYAYFIHNNIILEKAKELWKTFLFRQFDKISPLTPLYSVDPPYIFDYKQVSREPTGYYFDHTDDLIERLADNIAAVSDSLDRMYNLEVFFTFVPNSFTINHKLVTDDEYDNFIPRLEQALEVRGTRLINLYDYFADSNGSLYHPSDTHWNPAGVSLALDIFTDQLNQLWTHELPDSAN